MLLKREMKKDERPGNDRSPGVKKICTVLARIFTGKRWALIRKKKEEIKDTLTSSGDPSRKQLRDHRI